MYTTKLATKLWWPVSTNLDSLFTIFFIGLLENGSVHPNFEMSRLAVGLSLPDFLNTLEIWCCKKTANWKKDPSSMGVLLIINYIYGYLKDPF